jgi:hypothetical protein
VKNPLKKLVAAAAALLLAAPVLADVNVGVSLSLTGPGSGLGIPMQNQFKLWPQTVAGEKVNLIILDDASDPGKGVSNARRFVTDDKVDLIIGSCLTPVAAAMAPVAAEAKTLQIAASPVGLPPGQDQWLFRLPQSNDVMAHPMVQHMKKLGVKTLAELTAKLKAEPGKHNFGSGAISARVAGELYRMQAGVDAVSVSYKNNQLAAPDLSNGIISYMICDVGSARPSAPSCSSSTARMFSSTLSLRKIEASCGR